MATGDDQKIKGKFEQAKGAVKEGYGAMTGDRSTEMEGKLERAKGNLREGYGDLKNDLDRDVSKDDDITRRP